MYVSTFVSLINVKISFMVHLMQYVHQFYYWKKITQNANLKYFFIILKLLQGLKL